VVLPYALYCVNTDTTISMSVLNSSTFCTALVQRSTGTFSIDAVLLRWGYFPDVVLHDGNLRPFEDENHPSIHFVSLIVNFSSRHKNLAGQASQICHGAFYVRGLKLVWSFRLIFCQIRSDLLSDFRLRCEGTLEIRSSKHKLSAGAGRDGALAYGEGGAAGGGLPKAMAEAESWRFSGVGCRWETSACIESLRIHCGVQ